MQNHKNSVTIGATILGSNALLMIRNEEPWRGFLAFALIFQLFYSRFSSLLDGLVPINKQTVFFLNHYNVGRLMSVDRGAQSV